MASLIGFLITIVLFSPASYAKDPVNFGFKPEQCGISTSQELKFGDLGVAQVQLDLKMSPGPYHHPKVELLVNGLDIKKASLSWTTVPKKYFARPVSKSIQKERGRPYSFNKKGDKFISIHWGWLRSQHFVSLLLYKKYMQLTVIDQSDKTHVADVSLTGTTASFRKMAWECHKESTREYLKAEKKYKKNPATTNSAGFGLTSHGIYELSLPKDLRSQEKPFLENSGFSVEEQESRLKKYIPIAKDKSEALKIIAKKGKGKKFKANSKRVLKEYGRIQQLWPQMIALYGESPTTGSLNILKNKNAELLKEIKATDLEIKRLYRDLQEPKSENLREQTFRLTPYERRVGEYDRFIIETKLSLDATQEKIKILGGILKTYLSWLEGKAQDLSVDLKPLSYVEIIEVRDQQKEKISRIEALGQLIEQLKGAIARLDDVEKASEKIPQAFTDYIKARSDWSLGKESVEASDVAISKLDDKYRGYLRNLFEPLNKKSEELVGMILTKKGLKNDKATRTAKVEKTIHKHLLKELYKVLDHALNEAGKALVAKTVCSSKNYKQKFNKDEYCLAVQNLDGDLDKELTRYYESLSPKATDEHLATYLEEVPKVWPKGHGPKVTYLIEKFKEELSAMSEIHRKKIRNAWYHIEFLRWRANASIKYAKRVAKQDPSQVVGFDSSFYIS